MQLWASAFLRKAELYIILLLLNILLPSILVINSHSIIYLHSCQCSLLLYLIYLNTLFDRFREEMGDTEFFVSLQTDDAMAEEYAQAFYGAQEITPVGNKL